MTRARLFAFAATVSVAAATFACPKETDGSGGGGGGIVQPYGAPPRPPEPDAGSSEQPETSAIAPPATIEPPGTAPSLPNTAPTTKPSFGPGGPVAMYGGPPPPSKPIP